MRIGEIAQRAGVSIKAVRYYEQVGPIVPARAPNGYRQYSLTDLNVVREVRSLREAGISATVAHAFAACLHAGHEHGDDCVNSLIVHRKSIDTLDRLIQTLTERRNLMTRRLDEGAARTFSTEGTMNGYTSLPDNLPEPEDDGAAGYLQGERIPELTLATSNNATVDLSALGAGRTIIYIYPLTGRPGQDLPDGWDAIPGARGCSTEACDFRDHHAELHRAGATRVYGMSSQSVEYQAEVVERLHLPFTMISDPTFSVADALGLPSFPAPGHNRLYARLTLVIRDSVIEHVFHPIFPPNAHAQQVLDWLTTHPATV